MGKIRDVLKKWLAQPVIQFMMIGLVMFLADTYILQAKQASNEDEYKVYLTTGEVNSMKEMWTSRWQRAPTKDEMEGMINQRVEENILFREAVKIGLNKNDDIIRQRMAQKLEFLSNDLTKPDSASAEEVHLYFKQNIDKYHTPARITLTQLFINPRNYGDLLDNVVSVRLASLKKMDPSSPKIGQYGDQFSLQAYFPDKDQIELAKLFGSEFASTIFTLETDIWVGPVDSQYGTHIVYIAHKSPVVVPQFENVKVQVADDLQRQRQIELNSLYIEGLLSRYEVIIEERERTSLVE